MRREHEPLELPTEFDRQFGKRLTAARERCGMSRTDLAIAVDTDEAEIEAWELGLIVIYLDELTRVCLALKTSPNELTGLDLQ
jgi:ribosome-binding protein aMBF1 (putative translation factor)